MADAPSPRDRWRPRPAWSIALRGVVLVVPVACSVLAATVMSAWLPRPVGGLAVIGWWVAVLAASLAALLLVDVAVRRLLPLAALLRLSMLFPDQAPSRMRVARQAGSTGAVERQLARAREMDEGTPAGHAAEVILTLVTALSMHDRRTRGHSERVHLFADLLGDELGLGPDDRQRLRWAAMLHDIGKLDVDADLLNKPGAPDADEWERIRRHPHAGRRLIAPIVPWLGEWAAAVDQHHERYDGKGYPAGLAGEQIARSARIVSVADAYEVMTAARSYKRPVGPEAARRELAACAGTQFDPAVVRAFLNISIGKLRRVVWPVAFAAVIPAITRPAAAANAPVGSSATALVAAALLVGGGVGGGPGVAEDDSGVLSANDRPEAQVEAAEPADEQLMSMWLGRDAALDAGTGTSDARGLSRFPAMVPGTDESSEPRARIPMLPGAASTPDGRAAPPRPLAEDHERSPESGTERADAWADDTDPTADPPGARARESAQEDVAPSTTTRRSPLVSVEDADGPDDGDAALRDGRAAPRAAGDEAATTVGTAVAVDVLANDELHREVGRLRVIVDPRTGVAEVGPGLLITYTPDPDAAGRDRFRYQVCYEDGGCATAWVRITIE